MKDQELKDWVDILQIEDIDKVLQEALSDFMLRVFIRNDVFNQGLSFNVRRIYFERFEDADTFRQRAKNGKFYYKF